MKTLFFAFFLVLFVSCDSDEDPGNPGITDYRALNEAEIIKFINGNNLEATRSDSGLHYVIDESGTGEQPSQNSSVTVAYKGYFTDGTVFDSSDTNGITFSLNGVIDGWKEGIPYFKEGGSGLLLVPSHLGYGSADHNGIPGGSVLIFEVNLITIN